MDALFAALTIAIVASESQRRVTRTCCGSQPRERAIGPSGTLATSARRRTTVRAGTTQRTTENAPAEDPAMNRLGRSA